MYNGDEFLRDTLDSLLAQTFTDFELVISDNASTDTTEAICMEYAVCDPRIRYVRQSENLGAVSNWNFVLNEAAASYFMWAAADDYYSEEWLFELLKGIENSKYSCAMGRIVHVDSSNDSINRDTSHGAFITKIPELSGNERAVHRVLKFFLGRNDMLIYGLFKTKILKSFDLLLPPYTHLPFDTTYPYLYAMLTHGGVYQSKTARIFKRYHPSQLSSQFQVSLNGQYRINKNHTFLIKNYLKHTSLHFAERWFIYWFIKFYLLGSLIKNFQNFRLIKNKL